MKIVDDLRELYSYRELLFNLSRKEIRVKYKNSFLGFIWSLITPLMTLLVFYIVFGYIFQLNRDPNNPMNNFAIYLMSGLLPWTFFSNSLIQSVGSVIGNANLVKKVYFPREVLPLSNIAAGAFNFFLQFLVLFAFMVLVGHKMSYWILMLPLVLLLQTLFITGLALLLASVNVFLRDVQHLLEVVLTGWFWLTPIAYPVSLIRDTLPQWAQTLYFLNPMTHITCLYQYCVYNPVQNGPGVAYISPVGLAGTLCVSLIMIVIGYSFFTSRVGVFAKFI